MNFLIDTNIIISVYFSDITNDNKDSIRKQFYEKREKADSIYVSKISIVELYGFFRKKAYEGMSRDFRKEVSFRKFSKSEDFIKTKKKILIQIYSLFNDCKIKLVGINKKEVIEIISSSLEPNDYLILKDAISIPVKLLTEDKDFSDESENIVLIKNNR